MKAYTENLDYQGLVTVFETAKNALQEAKNQKKEVRAFFKSSKKEVEDKASVHAAHLKFRQAKLGQKFQALTTRAAELNLQEFVHAFNQEQKAAAKAAKKAEKAAKETKVKPSKKEENSTDAVAKPVSKVGKIKSTTKVSKQVTESTEVAKATKKAAKKVVVDTKEKAKTSEKAAVKATKKPATQPVVESEKVVAVVQEAAKNPVAVTSKVAEKPVVVTPKVVVTTTRVVEKPLAQTEVAQFTKTTINDLTVIEGIGPKIAQILGENKVKNFKALIATPIEDIKTWLKDNKLQFVDPTTWAEQAQLLDAGKMVEFETLKQSLKGGKRT
jgi:predicted flap endonuclease-1-like 5' DNA nuclease